EGGLGFDPIGGGGGSAQDFLADRVTGCAFAVKRAMRSGLQHRRGPVHEPGPFLGRTAGLHRGEEDLPGRVQQKIGSVGPSDAAVGLTRAGLSSNTYEMVAKSLATRMTAQIPERNAQHSKH